MIDEIFADIKKPQLVIQWRLTLRLPFGHIPFRGTTLHSCRLAGRQPSLNDVPSELLKLCGVNSVLLLAMSAACPGASDKIRDGLELNSSEG